MFAHEGHWCWYHVKSPSDGTIKKTPCRLCKRVEVRKNYPAVEIKPIQIIEPGDVPGLNSF